VLTEPMSDADIAAVIAAFGQAAGDAQRLGFDGIELHAAHGYLVDQFFWHVTNRRDDRFGGDLGARTTFAADVVRACRRAVGDGWPILLRFSQWKLQDYAAKLATTPAELERLLTPLVDAGVDVFDCSTRYFWQTEFADSPLTLAGWTKKVTGLPVIAVGAVWQRGDFLTHGAASPVPPEQRLAQAAEMIERGEVDCLAVGRALLADPEWAIKIQCGQYDRIRPFSTAALADLS
jgi:2,4-dienoyl-CoA reductase-like NADH-dependent reductase (Old Yellow Enzyme family)